MNKITINGVTFDAKGRNISIIGDSVTVDGVVIQNGLAGITTIEFKGDLANLETGGSVNVSGSVHGYVDAGGSVNCGNVGGSVDAGGSVNCGNVNGDVDAGGSIRMTR